jgi:hypothetical protein
VDDLRNTAGFVADRGGQLLHIGRLYSSTAGIGARSDVDPHHPRSEPRDLATVAPKVSAASWSPTVRTAAVTSLLPYTLQ